MIIRQKYLDQLIRFQDTDLVKIVTGVRRCGKSTLLDMMRDHLYEQGIPKERLLSFKMESMEFEGLGYRDLYRLVRSKTDAVEHPYLFFDELQEVEGWERVINSLRVDIDCDIYLTGSNAYLLSSEISTLLSGRYVEIEMLPLVYAEYLDFLGAKPLSRPGDAVNLLELEDGSVTTSDLMLEQFRRYGGLPFLAKSLPSREAHAAYLHSLYETVVVRDILERDRRRERRNLSNPDLLERVCAFLADNVGNENSINSIASALRGEGIKAANDTVDAYISALCEAYLFYPARRYDIKGKELLKTCGKHYVVDTGLRNYLQGYRDSDQGRIFENMVYLQLLYEGYNVTVGKLRAGEIDFVATKPGERIYIQATEDMTDSKTLERELSPLLALRDAYPKLVVAMRGSYPSDIDGVKIMVGSDFFLRNWNGLQVDK